MIKKLLFNIYNIRVVKYLMHFLPDSLYLKIQYWSIMGKKLNLKNPKGFNEKLQWLKIHDRKPKYSIYADKYSVRKFIEDTIGGEYLVNLLGVWEKAEEIDITNFPKKFVIKGSHDSGSVIVCRDKAKLNIDEVKSEMKKVLKKNNYYYGRDWPYKNIKPRIIAEEYLDNGTDGLIDYKFYCFHGEAKFLYISQGLENHQTAHITFYDLNGKRTPFQRADYPTHLIDPILPENFSEMLDIANKLAKKIEAPFIRIDLYNIAGRILFSEITFRPCSGYMRFTPSKWDEKVGSLLNCK